ncbi:MAG: hypothetical protein IPP05_16470 [Cytophagaceae bacterium]|nr:hypothetical protein [Cytophagaceae bacterium]MBL0302130.1 hypothetical protein [Cytophagaceae bacterium]
MGVYYSFVMRKTLLLFLLISFVSKAQLRKSEVSFYIDTTSIKELKDITGNQQFIKARNNIPSVGINRFPVWTKITVKNVSKDPQNLYAQILVPIMDSVQYFVVKNNTLLSKSDKMGWWAVLKNKKSPNPNNSYVFSIKGLETIEIYAKILKTHGTVRIPLQIEIEKEHFKEMTKKSEFWGWFLGMGFVVIFLNLFLYSLVKEKVYLFYSFYVFCQIFNLDSSEGVHSSLYMNGLLSISGRSVYYFSMTLLIISSILFLKSYLKIKELQPKIFSLVLCFLIIVGLIYVLLLATPESIMELITTKKVFIWVFFAWFFVSIAFGIFVLFYAIIKNLERNAAYLYLVAGVPLFLVGISQMLGNITVLPVESSTQRSYILIPAIVFEILVLCWWLAIRFKMYSDDRKNLLLERNKHQQIVLETGTKFQNQERNRMAKELHDGVGIDISIIKMKLEAINLDLLKKGLNTETHEIEDTIKSIDNVVTEIRNFSHNLVPPDLENNGLVHVLQNLIQNLQKVIRAVEINFTTNIKAKIPIDISHNLFFIAKELINNAINHASSSIIDIELMEYQSRVELCVSDNGKQYDFNTAIKKGGLGLRSIQSRVELLNGTFEVIAKKPMGSFHQIIIPK